MKLGTYSTFDVPHRPDDAKITQKTEDRAFEFLTLQFGKIKGKVRLVMNEHDFGPYPSFEIDYPNDIEEIKNMEDELREKTESDENATKLLATLDKWHEHAESIYDAYLGNFNEYL
jgi:hypothetical protein